MPDRRRRLRDADAIQVHDDGEQHRERDDGIARCASGASAIMAAEYTAESPAHVAGAAARWRGAKVRRVAERNGASVPIARLVRQARQGRVHPSELARPRAAARRLRRPADHRHLQHLVGADAVQRALPRDRRARQARRLGSRRPAVRVPGHVDRRDEPPPDAPCSSAISSAWTSRSRSAATRSTASSCSAAATRRRPRS